MRARFGELIHTHPECVGEAGGEQVTAVGGVGLDGAQVVGANLCPHGKVHLAHLSGDPEGAEPGPDDVTIPHAGSSSKFTEVCQPNTTGVLRFSRMICDYADVTGISYSFAMGETTQVGFRELPGDDAAVSLGQQIREAREREGMTQRDLAARVGVSVDTISNWERDFAKPKNKLARVRSVLHLDEPAAPAVVPDGAAAQPDEDDRSVALGDATDVQLIAELASRLGRLRHALSDLRRTVPLPGGRVEFRTEDILRTVTPPTVEPGEEDEPPTKRNIR